MVYEQMLGGEGGDHTLSDLLGFSPSGDDFDYVQSVINGVSENLPTIDERIENLLIDWSMDRLARVDLAILRVAAYEILYRSDVPDAVAIDEAVELAHAFCEEKSAGFINGLLGNLVREKNTQ